jgi:hypothetical protein
MNANNGIKVQSVNIQAEQRKTGNIPGLMTKTLRLEQEPVAAEVPDNLWRRRHLPIKREESDDTFANNQESRKQLSAWGRGVSFKM